VSCAGLVPVLALALAERAGLSELVSTKVAIGPSKVKSDAANLAGKLASIIAGMAAGVDCVDDLDVIRSGGTRLHQALAVVVGAGAARSCCPGWSRRESSARRRRRRRRGPVWPGGW
jgi:hypothetical protein